MRRAMRLRLATTPISASSALMRGMPWFGRWPWGLTDALQQADVGAARLLGLRSNQS